MKFEVAQCPQCGEVFNRTNPRKEYCRNACRVAAHRYRHGYQMPIFDRTQVTFVEQLANISSFELDMLIRDAKRYRLLKNWNNWSILNQTIGEEENKSFRLAFLKMKELEENDDYINDEVNRSVQFIRPLEGLVAYSQDRIHLMNDIEYLEDEA